MFVSTCICCNHVARKQNLDTLASHNGHYVLTKQVGHGFGSIEHRVAALKAVGHTCEVDLPTRRTELAAKGEDTKTLATAGTLLALASNGVFTLRTLLLLHLEVVPILTGAIGRIYIILHLSVTTYTVRNHHGNQRSKYNWWLCARAAEIESKGWQHLSRDSNT